MPAQADMTDANRRQVQEALRRLGYYRGPMDGIFGPLTQAAIRRFQQSVAAEPTGSLTAAEANRLVTTR
jgi:peptidoglycan hydrolase-like protein with peptidoglycan-binding domain